LRPEGGEHRISIVEEMASYYVKEVRTFQAEGPYYLGGFSFGGSVALEMAQQLHAQGEKVALLAILDHTPPPTRYRRVIWSPTLLLDFPLDIARWIVEDIWRAGEGRRLAALWAKVKTAKNQISKLFKRSPPPSGEADVEEIFAGQVFPEPFKRLLESHYQAMRDYVPRPYPGRVTLFRARARPLFRMHGHDLGWGKFAGGGLEVIVVPGNHETILKPPHVNVLAEALLNQLNKVRSGV
jgi:thioesterase domain-containing protein